MLSHLDNEGREDVAERIMMLLTLPTPVMPEEEKDRIRNVLGLIKNDNVSEEEQVREIVGLQDNLSSRIEVPLKQRR